MTDLEVILKRTEEIRGYKCHSDMEKVDFILACLEELFNARSLSDMLKQEVYLEKQNLLKAQEQVRRFQGNVIINI